MNFGYIGALVATWTSTNLRLQQRSKNLQSKNTSSGIWVAWWLLICFGFMLGMLIF